MKSFVLCACVLILVSCSSAKLKEKFKPEKAGNDILTCATENNATRDDWYKEEDVMTLLHVEPENIERTRKVGCWIACVMKKMDFMEGSNINEEKIIGRLDELVIDPENAREPVQKCLKEVRIITQKCEKSFSILTCLMRKAHEAQGHEEHEREETEEKPEPEKEDIVLVLRPLWMEESGSIKEGQFHAKLSELFGDSPVQVIAHKIARKCLKEVRGITQECEKCFSMYACVMRAVHKAQKHKDHGTDETEEAVEVAETEETGVAEPAE
ncbi:PREDICTED: pheromone-binding protein Gp-9-like [Wasmannia auropunctata]|uniref:pheromone-binding protein Gp-9-like n=1 Tax=Wasmannia auropunctata TaxID=64793 RepID=UPI0005EE7AFC|nr:PREDICTED: pheromone-binding protein Gp-9-like [Wasmannia auropunctata]